MVWVGNVPLEGLHISERASVLPIPKDCWLPQGLWEGFWGRMEETCIL